MFSGTVFWDVVILKISGQAKSIFVSSSESPLCLPALTGVCGGPSTSGPREVESLQPSYWGARVLLTLFIWFLHKMKITPARCNQGVSFYKVSPNKERPPRIPQ